ISPWDTISLPGRWPQRLAPTWSSIWQAAAPALISDLTVRSMLNALGPKPVSMSTSSGSSHTSVMRRASISTSSSVLMPRSGMPSEPAATPPPDRYTARKPARSASRAWLALMAPITCSGDSSASAARKRAPGEALLIFQTPADRGSPDAPGQGSARQEHRLAPNNLLINLDQLNQYVRMDDEFIPATRACALLGIPPAPLD